MYRFLSWATTALIQRLNILMVRGQQWFDSIWDWLRRRPDLPKVAGDAQSNPNMQKLEVECLDRASGSRSAA